MAKGKVVVDFGGKGNITIDLEKKRKLKPTDWYCVSLIALIGGACIGASLPIFSPILLSVGIIFILAYIFILTKHIKNNED